MSAHIKTERSWFGVLFGAFFLIPVLYLFFSSMLSSFYDAGRMQFWHSAEAKLTHSEVRYFYGDSTTYKATAQYHYQVNGRYFEGDRVSVQGGSDNIGSYHKDIGRQLSRQRSSGKPLMIWYNPDNPAESVIDRSIRWELVGFYSIFVILFGLVGGGAVYWSLFGNKVNTATETIEKPWLSRPEWMHNRIVSNSKNGVYGAAFLALFWNLLSWPIVIFSFSEVLEEEGWLIALAITAFPLVGIFLTCWFVKLWLGWRRFGGTPLVMNPFPGAISGQVGGSIDIPSVLPRHCHYGLTLSCTHSYTRNDESHNKLIWQAESLANLELNRHGSQLTFCFDVPAGLPISSTDSTSDGTYRWQLHLESSNGKLVRDYTLPVFATGEASSIKLKDTSAQTAVAEHRLLQKHLPLQTPISHARHPQGKTTVYYPTFYRPANKLLFLAISGLFLAISIGIWNQKDAYIISWGFLLLSAPTFTITAISLLTSVRVTLDQKKITSEKHFLGLPIKRQSAHFNQVVDIKSKEVMRSESSGKHTVHYQVDALLHNGKKMLLAKSIDGDKAAGLIEAFFRQRIFEHIREIDVRTGLYCQ